MNRSLIQLFGLFLLLSVPSPCVANGDWPWWRGPGRNGVADSDQDPPVNFDEDRHCRWSVAIPGRSHGSASVVGDQLFLQVADEEKKTQSLLCFDRKDGSERWSALVHEGGQTQKTNKKATWASSTPACDGERVFVNFLNGDAVFTTAVSLEGKQLWQTKISDYAVHQGYGSSPAIYQDLVIVSADNKRGGAVAALNRKTGKIVWQNKRAKDPNYASPVVLEVAGRDQLLFTGLDRVSSFDPLTGETLWEIEGATTECVTSTVTDGERIFTSGGYPKNHVAAIAGDGSGKVVWEVKDRVYVPSMLVREGFLYAVMDSGVAICWKSDTGEEMWKARLGGNFTSSPVLVGDRIYAGNESGEVYVFKADPGGLEVLSKNKIGSQIFATPAISGGEIFLRYTHLEGEKRTEKLSCFAKD